MKDFLVSQALARENGLSDYILSMLSFCMTGKGHGEYGKRDNDKGGRYICSDSASRHSESVSRCIGGRRASRPRPGR